MNRRQMLTTAGAAAAAAGFVSTTSAGVQAPKPGSSAAKTERPVMRQSCLETCTRCSIVCTETAQHCLEYLGKGHADHLRSAELTLACQEFCALSAKMIASSSSLMMAACEACAKACETCAAECEKMKSDEQMAACEKACRECAASCRKMS